VRRISDRIKIVLTPTPNARPALTRAGRFYNATSKDYWLTTEVAVLAVIGAEWPFVDVYAGQVLRRLQAPMLRVAAPSAKIRSFFIK
jgi:hypothetical protein